MSSEASVAYGYGFELGSLVTDKELAKKFICQHQHKVSKDNAKEIGKVIHRMEHHGDIMDYDDENTINPEILDMIATIMFWETGIRFEYEIGEDGVSNPAIIFPVKYPWQLNETEKSLTEKSLNKIVRKYVDELGIITTVGYISVEYFS